MPKTDATLYDLFEQSNPLINLICLRHNRMAKSCL